MSLITLHNQNIDPVIWEDAISGSFDIHNQADIWRVNVSTNLLYIDDMLKTLDPAEVARAEKYLRVADRNRFIVSRSTLRNVLGNYLKQEPGIIEFRFGNNKKPYIAGPVHFNLSDSGDWVVIAIAKTEIGIDVEYIKPGFNYDGIINSHFNAQEVEYIEADNKLRRFFKLWTRKEAILKATGIGLTENLVSITVLDGRLCLEGGLLSTQTNWELSTFMLAENYPVTIAAGPMVEKCNFYDYKIK